MHTKLFPWIMSISSHKLWALIVSMEPSDLWNPTMLVLILDFLCWYFWVSSLFCLFPKLATIVLLDYIENSGSIVLGPLWIPGSMYFFSQNEPNCFLCLWMFAQGVIFYPNLVQLIHLLILNFLNSSYSWWFVCLWIQIICRLEMSHLKDEFFCWYIEFCNRISWKVSNV